MVQFYLARELLKELKRSNFQPGGLGRGEWSPLGTIRPTISGIHLNHQPHQPKSPSNNNNWTAGKSSGCTARREPKRGVGCSTGSAGRRWVDRGGLGRCLPVLLAPTQSWTDGGTPPRRLQVVSVQHENWDIRQSEPAKLSWLKFGLKVFSVHPVSQNREL